MDTPVLIGLFGALILVAGGASAVIYSALTKKSANSGMQALMQQSRVAAATKLKVEKSEDQMKAMARKKVKTAKSEPTLDEKFFHAGMFSDAEKKEFNRLRGLLPIIGGAVGLAAGLYLQGLFLILFPLIFAMVAYQAPVTLLDRRIKARSDDIMFYLPLVIEQIVIGVSSSLDIGPCLQRVVAMADERGSHNSVTELIRIAQLYMKSGVSLDEAMTEVGKLSGHTELKHAFMNLSQVAKHGGEITRQLQELADAVATQRETSIEGKIKKLELEATGPVGLVFFGFLIILLSGFGNQILKSFK